MLAVGSKCETFSRGNVFLNFLRSRSNKLLTCTFHSPKYFHRVFTISSGTRTDKDVKFRSSREKKTFFFFFIFNFYLKRKSEENSDNRKVFRRVKKGKFCDNVFAIFVLQLI